MSIFNQIDVDTTRPFSSARLVFKLNCSPCRVQQASDTLTAWWKGQRLTKRAMNHAANLGSVRSRMSHSLQNTSSSGRWRDQSDIEWRNMHENSLNVVNSALGSIDIWPYCITHMHRLRPIWVWQCPICIWYFAMLCSVYIFNKLSNNSSRHIIVEYHQQHQLCRMW